MAQSTLEFANGSGPTTNGSTITNQVITFQNNATNPTTNTFVPFIPTTTATFSISNQQYILPTGQNANHGDLSFGGTINASGQTIVPFALTSNMNTVGGASNGNFSASQSNIGTGISVSSNYAVEVFNSAMGLYNASLSTSGRYYIADLTITFNNSINNPVLHLVGLGGSYSIGSPTLGLTSELELQTSGVTLSKLSGSTELNVTSTKILNSDNHPTATTGSGAASGSVLVTGNNITSLVFKIYLRGDGGLSAWSTSSAHVGDAFMIGVSALSTAVTLPVTISDFTAAAVAGTTSLQWTTTLEENSDHFDIQHSIDGKSWESIGEVNAAGNSSTLKDYGFVHSSPASGNNYYRLLEVDLDGRSAYSVIRGVSFSTKVKLTCYPNPTVNSVTIVSDANNLQSVALMSIDGKTLQVNPHFVSGGSFDLSRYPRGMYLLAIRDTEGNAEVAKIQKN